MRVGYDNKLSDLEKPLLTQSTAIQTLPTQDDQSEFGIADKKSDLKLHLVLLQIAKLSVCPIISMIFHPAYQAANTIIIGKHQNAVQLQATLGLTTLFMNTLIVTIQIGFNGSLSTLISQAFGQKDYRLCGLYLNRQLMLNGLIFLPMVIIMMFSKELYLLLGQDADMASEAATFLQITLPGFFCFGQYLCYQRFLAAQREVRFAMYINLVCFFLHIPLCYYLAISSDLQLVGVAIATSLHFGFRLIMMLICIRFSRFYKSIISLRDPDNFWNFKVQLKMSFQNSMMFISGQWALESFTLMSTFMSLQVIAAQIVCRNIILIVYMVPVGLAQASSVFVGNMIGQKKLKDAQIYAKMGALCSFIWGLFFVVIMTIMKTYVVQLFSSSLEINELVYQVFPILQVYVLIDSLQGMGIGLITGIGRQAKASIFTMTGFWGIGVPTAIILSFSFKLNLIGLWIGALVSISFCCISYYILIINTDWKQRIKEAIQRRRSEKKLP
ncbi:na+-driven multidrug efflux pump [Stylonychia lemnae]|uniref:Na+-driven multidrug efflux pump n=1 Tax=Stylonychia lemnae TaxID=5949 RepID=A0A078B5F3_STYLE|nr:na+-driven multidrug efflux pump [Stylonychia lemnae]|eukprot:CDW89421.1 na+-driven multidrug efflux pump [Stylonychia lemnae]